MPLDLPVMFALAQACGPSVAPTTLVSVARVESGFDPLVIGVNGPRRVQIRPATKADAVAAATRLAGEGANFDLGLGQINVRNLGPLGLTVADAFDPCRNLAASARILSTDYGLASRKPGPVQAALRTSLSLYNSGDVLRGFRNGYVGKVVAAAGGGPEPAPNDDADTRPAPAWDVFARASRTDSPTFVFNRSGPSGDAP